MAVAGLFISHVQSPRIIDHFVRLRKESGHLVDWRFVFAQGRSGSPLVDFPYEPAESSMPLRFREMVENRGVIDGLLDTAIMPCVVALNSRFVWVMEYDVDFAGQWSSCFEQFSGNTVDLLTTTIVRKIRSPTWYHWRRVTAPSSVLPGQMLRSFLPIMRLSREFACEYVKRTTQPGWRPLRVYASNSGACPWIFVGRHWWFGRILSPLQKRIKLHELSSRRGISSRNIRFQTITVALLSRVVRRIFGSRFLVPPG